MAPEAPTRADAQREPARRLFFALWPDEAMRQAMTQATRKAVRASGGRPVAVANLHITLAFLGSVPERRLPELAAIARAAAARPRSACADIHADAEDARSRGLPLELAFDRLECWRAAHILCALPAEAPAPVAVLARQLQDLLAASGFAPDLKPFRPHVTVARKVVRPVAVGRLQPVVWRFTDLALIESRTLPEGAVYTVVQSEPLAAAAQYP